MPSRPNLLIVHTDQQSCWSLGCYGGRVGDTPRLDALAAVPHSIQHPNS
ncbi:MAG: hypothetical protein M5U26_27630 [Planctomycetota bacterium]|nr:hypothetical protein [Planctomycetota bacterium]